MKKHYLFIILMFAAFATNAQITITTADLPTAGMVRLQPADSMATRVNSISPGSAGTSQTWDFAGLTEQYIDTLLFLASNTTPYYSNFPTSTLAIPGRMNGAPSYTYIKTDATGAYALGIVGIINTMFPNPMILPLSPQSTYVRTPSTYQSTYTEQYVIRIKESTVGTSLSQYGDSVRMHSRVTALSIVDGYGSITTPSGTYNAIRQKITAINTDTAWIHNAGYPPIVPPSWQQVQVSKDTTITYRWWANGIGIPVMEMERDAHTNAKTKKVNWYKPINLTVYAINGSLTYVNANNTAMNGVTVNLLSNGTQVASTTTDALGNFTFSAVPNGTYTLAFSTTKPWSGVTATDVLKIKRHVAGLELLTDPLKVLAGDVNNSNTITATDALKVQRRSVGLDASFTKPDWIFESSAGTGLSVTVNGSNASAQIKAICTGDVNGSNVPVY